MYVCERLWPRFVMVPGESLQKEPYQTFCTYTLESRGAHLCASARAGVVWSVGE